MLPVKSLLKFGTLNKNRMKSRYILLIFFIAGTILTASAQVHLRISSLSRFPVSPLDTVYELNTYDSIQIQVQNIGNVVLNADNISVYILGGTPASGPDTLYEDSTLYTLQNGSVANLSVSGFVFKPTHFEDGDNIVVVWPVARLTPHTSDSLTFHIYYISLLAGIVDPEKDLVVISPNPANDYIALEIPPDLGVQQVRIIDLLGRPVISLKAGFNYIPTSDWNAGIYLLQYIDSFGRQVTKRIIKN